MPQVPTARPVYRSINKPLTIWGAERRLFFLALVVGATMFNFFGSLLGGLMMFAALFAAEQGESVAPAAAPPRPETPAVVTDSLVDEVTRRVLQRLAPDAANDLVVQIVSEVAERLIREEISRIKAAAATRL